MIYLQPFFFLNCCNFLRSGYTCRISIYISNEFKNQEWNFINATISTCSMYCTIIKEWQSWQIMEALEKIKDIIYSYFKNEHSGICSYGILVFQSIIYTRFKYPISMYSFTLRVPELSILHTEYMYIYQYINIT